MEQSQLNAIVTLEKNNFTGLKAHATLSAFYANPYLFGFEHGKGIGKDTLKKTAEAGGSTPERRVMHRLNHLVKQIDRMVKAADSFGLPAFDVDWANCWADYMRGFNAGLIEKATPLGNSPEIIAFQEQIAKRTPGSLTVGY